MKRQSNHLKVYILTKEKYYVYEIWSYYDNEKKAVCYSESLVAIYSSTWRYNQKTEKNRDHVVRRAIYIRWVSKEPVQMYVRW
jgi:hypothetical protein